MTTDDKKYILRNFNIITQMACFLKSYIMDCVLIFVSLTHLKENIGKRASKISLISKINVQRYIDGELREIGFSERYVFRNYFSFFPLCARVFCDSLTSEMEMTKRASCCKFVMTYNIIYCHNISYMITQNNLQSVIAATVDS